MTEAPRHGDEAFRRSASPRVNESLACDPSPAYPTHSPRGLPPIPPPVPPTHAPEAPTPLPGSGPDRLRGARGRARAAQVQVTLRPLAPPEAFFVADLLPGSSAARPDLLGITLVLSDPATGAAAWAGTAAAPSRRAHHLAGDHAWRRESPSPAQIFRGTTDPFVLNQPVRHLTAARAGDARPRRVHHRLHRRTTQAMDGAGGRSGRLPPGTYLFTRHRARRARAAVLDDDELRMTFSAATRVELLSPGAPGRPAAHRGARPHAALPLERRRGAGRALPAAGGEGGRRRLGRGGAAVAASPPGTRRVTGHLGASTPRRSRRCGWSRAPPTRGRSRASCAPPADGEAVESPIYWFRVGGAGGRRAAAGALEPALRRAAAGAGALRAGRVHARWAPPSKTGGRFPSTSWKSCWRRSRPARSPSSPCASADRGADDDEASKDGRPALAGCLAAFGAGEGAAAAGRRGARLPAAAGRADGGDPAGRPRAARAAGRAPEQRRPAGHLQANTRAALRFTDDGSILRAEPQRAGAPELGRRARRGGAHPGAGVRRAVGAGGPPPGHHAAGADAGRRGGGEGHRVRGAGGRARRDHGAHPGGRGRVLQPGSGRVDLPAGQQGDGRLRRRRPTREPATAAELRQGRGGARRRGRGRCRAPGSRCCCATPPARRAR